MKEYYLLLVTSLESQYPFNLHVTRRIVRIDSTEEDPMERAEDLAVEVIHINPGRILGNWHAFRIPDEINPVDDQGNVVVNLAQVLP